MKKEFTKYNIRKTANMKSRQLKTVHGIDWEIKEITDTAKLYMDKTQKPFLSIRDFVDIFKQCGWEKNND